MIRKLFVDCAMVLAVCMVAWGSAPVAVAQVAEFCCGLNNATCSTPTVKDAVTGKCLTTPSCNSLWFSCTCTTTGTTPAGGYDCRCRPS